MACDTESCYDKYIHIYNGGVVGCWTTDSKNRRATLFYIILNFASRTPSTSFEQKESKKVMLLYVKTRGPRGLWHPPGSHKPIGLCGFFSVQNSIYIFVIGNYGTIPNILFMQT